MASLRLVRRLVRLITGVLLLVGFALVVLVVAVRTPVGERQLREWIRSVLVQATDARVSIGRVGGSLISGFWAHDVLLQFPGGARVDAKELSASYALHVLLTGRIELGTVRLRDVRVRALTTAEGWGFVAPGPASETPLPTLSIDRVVIEDGRADLALGDTMPRRLALTQLSLDGSFAMDPREIRVGLTGLHAVPRGVAVAPLWGEGTVVIGATGDAIQAQDLTIATERSRLEATGQVVFDHRVDLRLATAPLAMRELRAVVPEVPIRPDLEGTLVARGPWQRIAVRSDLRTRNAGVIRLFGTTNGRADGFPSAARARVRHLDLAAIDPSLPPSNLTGHVAAQGAITSLEKPLDLQLRLAPSGIESMDVQEARLAGRVVSDGLDARGEVVTRAGRATVDGKLSWAGETVYSARTRLDVGDLAALVPALPGSGHVRATVQGRGFTGPSRTATLDAHVDGARVLAVPVDDGDMKLALRGDLLRVENGAFVVGGLRTTVAGAMDLQRQTLEATLSATGDPTAAARSIGAQVGGAITARASVRGPLHQLAVDGTLTGENVRTSSATLQRGALTANLTGVGGEGMAGRLTADLTGLRVAESSPWTGTMAADVQRSGGIDGAALRFDGHAEDGGRLLARATVRRLLTGDVEADLSQLSATVPDHGTWTLVRPASLAYRAGTLFVDRFEVTADSQRITVAGRAGASGPADLSLEWTDVDLGALCKLRGLVCTGSTDGTVKVTGTAASPLLTLTARADRVTFEKAPTTALAITGSYGDRLLSVRSTVTQAEAGRLDLSGALPVDLAWEGPRRDLSDAPVDLTLQTDGLDLAVVRLLAPDAVRQSAGRLAGDLRLRGPWRDLRAEGTMSLHDGSLGLRATGVSYDQIEIAAVARGQTIAIESLRAHAGDGTVEGSGNLALAPTTTTPFALHLRFDRFLAVALPAYEGATDGTLTVEGSLAYPVVRGELTLTRLLVRPTLLETTSGPSLEPDPTIEVVGREEEPEAGPAAPSVDVADALSLDVQVSIDRDAWIRRSDADVELRGKIRVGKEAYKPLFVTGEIRLVRGWYAFQGRRFDLDEGRIIFGGDVPPDPQLDITAINKTGEYEVKVEITGRASAPALALSSEPPLEQADILSLLVFGRPARDLGHEQSVDLQRKAISLASGYVMPELRQSVMNTLGLDTFEVGDEGVRAGRYVTRDVFISLAQDFTGRVGQVMGVEYAVTRRMSLKLSTSTRGDSAVDFLWRRRY
jgi:translocation and assembly module TamB